MRFSAEWVEGGKNASAEERSTLCELSVALGDEGTNVSTFYDLKDERHFESILLPAVHLAEGIASDWWHVFGGRDVEHRFLRWRTGFALPDVRLEFNGVRLAVSCRRSSMQNPPLLFLHSKSEQLERGDAELALSSLVDQVVDKLEADGIAASQTAHAWRQVSESRGDPAEAAFCEAAGALGISPYDITEADAAFIEDAANCFEGEALVEFLAGVRQFAGTVAPRSDLIDWVSSRRPRVGSRLPDLEALAHQLAGRQKDPLDRPWAQGVRMARACRAALDIDPTAATTIKGVAEQLGGMRLAHAAGPAGIYALVARHDDGVHIHLRHRGGAAWARDAEKFAFARALGDALCFSDVQRAPVNSLHRAERQAVGRAFAAEFTAPVAAVLEMHRDGKDVDDIAGAFGVNSQLVDHQMENAVRTLAIAA